MKANRGLSQYSLVVSFLLLLACSAVALPPGFYDYINHDPIQINGNGDFVSSSGVTRGSGTPDDPYVISTWNIVPSSSMGAGTAIRITNTTVTVLIEYVHVQDGRYGIFLENATNVTIENCWMTENEFGVNLEDCVSCQILNNSLTDNQRAIREFECANLVIWNNSFERNAADMIHGGSGAIVWWVVILAALLGAAIIVLLYLMRISFTARRKPEYRIGTRLMACGLIQLVEVFQIGPYLGRAFGNGAMNWDHYVMWTGVAILVGIISTVFVLLYKAKWMESKLP